MTTRIVTLIILLLFAFAMASIVKGETVATNYSVDLEGKVDTRRPCCWGNEDSFIWPMKFTPDPNVVDGVIQIEEIHGDLVSWPTSKGAAPAIIPEGRFVGLLVALHRSSRWDSGEFCEFCNRDCLLYMQDALSSQKPVSRIPYDIVDMGYRLGPDHTLYVKVAQWLNDAGVMVHMEPTLTIKYRTVSRHERTTRSGTGGGYSVDQNR